MFRLNEKCKKLESDGNVRVPVLEKQIVNIHKRIDEQAKKIYSIINRDNSVYKRSWDLQRNNITRCVDYVKYTIRSPIMYFRFDTGFFSTRILVSDFFFFFFADQSDRLHGTPVFGYRRNAFSVRKIDREFDDDH